ncbi:hypothetical protein BU26DRAFT_524558 [Trematosphaeria pertusa]|uniref:Thioredoxin-like fold domain-containing protein n=1 Tax=Trematosphaeria pertusa TaxID=390896 RepID=A0A6A6HXW3_9PLEO|nr:uncharacterized protein BU26DRAFT_524558 [Trematosphaeria pertusa]KAF2242443.1 hypothetical protein BU26DRAFT_524558 [Trematosphaeria pertusa]
MGSNPKPNITLYRGWDESGRYVWSPFVTKVEFRLRTSEAPYTCAVGSTRSGPKGKIPYVELMTPNNPTECLADSSLIIKDFSDRGLITDVNARLSPAERGQDLAVRALMEDKLCFCHTYERWIKHYYIMRDHALWSIPYPMRVVIGVLAYRGNVRKLHDQGTGRFTDAEIRGLIKEVWEGVNGMLEESRRRGKQGECFWVLGGDEPTEADATVFGFVVSVLVCDAGPESRELIKKEFPVVVEYAELIHKRWFPDYEMWA